MAVPKKVPMAETPPSAPPSLKGSTRSVRLAAATAAPTISGRPVPMFSRAPTAACLQKSWAPRRPIRASLAVRVGVSLRRVLTISTTRCPSATVHSEPIERNGYPPFE